MVTGSALIIGIVAACPYLDKAIGIEISHLSLTILEVLTKDDNKNRGGRFRVLGVNNQVV